MGATSLSNQTFNLSRRSFIVSAGISVSLLSACSVLPPIPKRPDPKTTDALGWITLTPQGQWRLFSPRMEMGQNILSGLRDIAAIELDVPANIIDVRLPSTEQIARVKATVGSDSIRELALPLAQACFLLRAAVLQRAQQQLKAASPDELAIMSDHVLAKDGRRVALKDLAKPALTLVAMDVSKTRLRFFASKASSLPSASPFAQQQAILRGEAIYAADIMLPNMLYALVLRSPWPDKSLANSALQSIDETALRAVPGFQGLVNIAGLAGPALVATRIAALEPMRLAAKAQWQAPHFEQADAMRLINVDAALSANRFSKSKGSVDFSDSPSSGRNINVRLDVPLASHAAIEPRCAVARPLPGGGIELWTGTQDPFYIRDVLKRDTGLALEKITVHAMRIGGAFGGRTIATVEREACALALALGRPVKVQWSRADEFQAGFHRQPSSHKIQARMDATGTISDWRHSLSTSHVLFTNAILPAWLQSLTNLIGDDGAARGQQTMYGFARQQMDLQLTRLPVLTGPWRGLGAGPNVLAIEMAMDIAARRVGADSLEFRLKHLALPSAYRSQADAQRLALCLRSVSQLARAKPIKPLQQQRLTAKLDPNLKLIRTQGLACGAYKGASFAAAVAEIVMGITAAGQVKFIKAVKLWCSHDCGQVVNEAGVLAQVQGNLVWCIGMVLKERLDARQGSPEQLNFSQYSIPTITDVPDMEIQLIASEAAPSGAGETAIAAGAGAIANAVSRAFIEAGLQVPDSMPITAP